MAEPGPPEAPKVHAAWAYVVFMTPGGQVVAAVDRTLLGDGIRTLRAPTADEILGSLAAMEQDIFAQRIAAEISAKYSET